MPPPQTSRHRRAAAARRIECRQKRKLNHASTTARPDILLHATCTLYPQKVNADNFRLNRITPDCLSFIYSFSRRRPFIKLYRLCHPQSSTSESGCYILIFNRSKMQQTIQNERRKRKKRTEESYILRSKNMDKTRVLSRIQSQRGCNPKAGVPPLPPFPPPLTPSLPFPPGPSPPLRSRAP